MFETICLLLVVCLNLSLGFFHSPLVPGPQPRAKPIQQSTLSTSQELLMKDTELLSVLAESFPNATGYETVGTVTQANADGFRLIVAPSGEEVFCKRVSASKYAATKKSWPDFRRTLVYLRTEVNFYERVVPDLLACGFPRGAVPGIYHAGCDLAGLVAEEEAATDQSGPAPSDWNSPSLVGGKGGHIVMEAIPDDKYFQDSPITIDQAKSTLSAAAALHASAWGETGLLEKAERWLSRGSYHLKTRNTKELEGMEAAWESFSTAFRHLDPDLFDRAENLGARIKGLAEYVSEEVSPGATDPYATLPHGDFKSMNCFLPKHTGDPVVMVDFASTGVGLGMSDVAMHIHHAVRPGDLENGGEQELWDHYFETLTKLLENKSGGSCAYPREVAERHYRLAVADYFRFFLGRFWKTATPESMQAKASSKNTALINRDADAALRFLRRAEECVRQIEAERKESDEL